MLSGGQFSKSRKHAVWPSFLERCDPDTLRYYLSINMPENHDTDFDWPDFVAKVNNELIGTYGNFAHRVATLTARLDSHEDVNPLTQFDSPETYPDELDKVRQAYEEATAKLDAHRYKEALRTIMGIAQQGNQLLQAATPWKFLSTEDDASSEERLRSLAALAFSWRMCRSLAILTQPFIPHSAQKLWENLGEEGSVSEQLWESAIDFSSTMRCAPSKVEPLFTKLDLERILEDEQTHVSKEETESDPGHAIKGSKKKSKEVKKEMEGVEYLDFETFMKVDVRVGKITKVEDHPNADRLYVVNIDDGSKDGRTVCAGLKEFYSVEELQGKTIAFIANLEPRPLRGVMSEGMLLAADDDAGTVALVTFDRDISPGSKIR